MIAHLHRLQATHKISLTIVAVGLLGLLMVYYTSAYYRDIAHEQQMRTLRVLTALKVEELIDEMRQQSTDLAVAIQQQADFDRLVRASERDQLVQMLDEQFHQYFVTARILKLLKLYVIDNNFDLLSASGEGVDVRNPAALICPSLARIASSRVGPERLQVIASTCGLDGRPVYAVLVPFGGLSPMGYIQVVSDIPAALQRLDSALGMPLELRMHNGDVLYRSDEWGLYRGDADRLSVTYSFITDESQPALLISLLSDMSEFNSKLTSRRNLVILIALATTVITIVAVLLLLRRTTIVPLCRIQNVLEHIHCDDRTNAETGRILFAELLDEIIRLRNNKQSCFAVMMLDLKNFRAINETLGREAGDTLLQLIEDRLTGILRDSDLVSWVGTDSPGTRLRPVNRKTEYRATIARLGGDEFGLLLPSARSSEQALAVARRVIDALTPVYAIDSRQVSIGCCIGISMYPANGEDEKELVRAADRAMFEAGKQAGKYCIYYAEPL